MADDLGQNPKVVPPGLPVPPKRLVPSFYLKFKAIPCRYPLGSCRWGPQCIYAHGEQELRASGYGPTPEEAAERRIKLPQPLIDWWSTVRKSHAQLFASVATTGPVGTATEATQAAPQGGNSSNSSGTAAPVPPRSHVHGGSNRTSAAAIAAAEPHLLIAAQVERASSALGYMLEVYTQVRPADGPLPKLHAVQSEAEEVNLYMRDMADQLLALSLQYEELEQAVGSDPTALAHLPSVVQRKQQMEATYMQLAPQVKQMNSLLKKVLRMAPLYSADQQGPQQSLQQQLQPSASYQQQQQQPQHQQQQFQQQQQQQPHHHHHQQQFQQQQNGHQAAETGQLSMTGTVKHSQLGSHQGPLHHVSTTHVDGTQDQPVQPCLPVHTVGSHTSSHAATMPRSNSMSECLAQLRLNDVAVEDSHKPKPQQPQQQVSPEAQQAAVQGDPCSQSQAGQQAQVHEHGSPVEGFKGTHQEGQDGYQEQEEEEEETQEDEEEVEPQPTADETERKARQAADSARRAAEAEAQRKSAAQAAALARAGQAWVKEFKAKHTLWNKLYMPLLCKPGSDESFHRCHHAITSKPRYEAVKAAVDYHNLRLVTVCHDLSPHELRDHLALPDNWLMESTPGWREAPCSLKAYWTSIMWEIAMQQKVDSLKAMISYMYQNSNCKDIGVTPDNWFHMMQLGRTLFATLVANNKHKTLDYLTQRYDLELLLHHDIKAVTAVPGCSFTDSGILAWAQGLGAGVETLQVLVKKAELEGMLAEEYEEEVAFVHHLLSGGYPPALLVTYLTAAGITVRACPHYRWDLSRLLTRLSPDEDQEEEESSDDSDECDDDADDDDDDDEVFTTDSEADSPSEDSEDSDGEVAHHHAATNRIGNYLHAVLQSATPSSALQLVKDALMMCKKETSTLLDMSMQMAHGLLFVNQCQNNRSPLTQALMRKPLLPQLDDILNVLIKHGAMPLPPGPNRCPAGHKLYMDYPLMVAIGMVGSCSIDLKTGVRVVKIMAGSCKESINKVQPEEFGHMNALAWAAMQGHYAPELVAALMSSSVADPLWPLTARRNKAMGWVTPLAVGLLRKEGRSEVCKAMLVNWTAGMLLEAVHPGHTTRYLDTLLEWVSTDKEARDILLRPLGKLNKALHERYMAALLQPGRSHLRDLIFDHAPQFRFDGVCVLETMQRTGLTVKQVSQMLSRGAHVTVLPPSKLPNSSSHQPASAPLNKLPAHSSKGSSVSANGEGTRSARPAAPLSSSAVSSGRSSSHDVKVGGWSVSMLEVGTHVHASTASKQGTNQPQQSGGASGKGGAQSASWTQPQGNAPAQVPSGLAGILNMFDSLYTRRRSGPLAVMTKAEAELRAMKRRRQEWRQGRGIYFGKHVYGDNKKSSQSDHDQEEEDETTVDSSSDDSSDDDSWFGSRHSHKHNRKGAGKKKQRRSGWPEGLEVLPAIKKPGFPALGVLLQMLLQRCSSDPVPEAYQLDACFNTLLWPVCEAQTDASSSGHTNAGSGHTGSSNGSNGGQSAAANSNGNHVPSIGPAASVDGSQGSKARRPQRHTLVLKNGDRCPCAAARGARQLLLLLLEAKDQRGKGPVRSVHLPQMRLQACHLFGAGEGTQPGVAQLLQILLKAGCVDPKERDPRRCGMSLLHLAAADHAEEACAVLLKAGANPAAVIEPHPASSEAPQLWAAHGFGTSQQPALTAVTALCDDEFAASAELKAVAGRQRKATRQDDAMVVSASLAAGRIESLIGVGGLGLPKAIKTQSHPKTSSEPVQAETGLHSSSVHDRLVGSTPLHMCVWAQLAWVDRQVAEACVRDVLLEAAEFQTCHCCMHRTTTAPAKYDVESVSSPKHVVLEDEDAIPGLGVMQLLINACPELVHTSNTPSQGVSAVPSTPGGLYHVDAPHMATLKAAYDSVCQKAKV